MRTIEKDIKFLQESLLKWFEGNQRNFPWRHQAASNYVLIISEILLQRTRAETVAKFFTYFVEKYPTWSALGIATEEELTDILKPLGLSQQRGKRLYKLAQELKKRDGKFPIVRSEVEELPMMGQYITNSFELFVLNKRSPLLDVNMARVLERLFGKRDLADIRYDPRLQKLARRVVDHDMAIELNWAILDFAALVCSARNPQCNSCVFRNKCVYLKNL